MFDIHYYDIYIECGLLFCVCVSVLCLVLIVLWFSFCHLLMCFEIVVLLCYVYTLLYTNSNLICLCCPWFVLCASAFCFIWLLYMHISNYWLSMLYLLLCCFVSAMCLFLCMNIINYVHVDLFLFYTFGCCILFLFCMCLLLL